MYQPAANKMTGKSIELTSRNLRISIYFVNNDISKLKPCLVASAKMREANETTYIWGA